MIFVLFLSFLGFSQTTDPCAKHELLIVVDTTERELRLCSEFKTEKIYKVALGKKGVGKKEEGDKKTPLGRYLVSKGRPSASFGTFIYVGYPTVDQKKQGYSGDSIGIHGPSRAFRWAGVLNTMVNWTDGCIAVGTDFEILEISNWVSLRSPVFVQID